MMSTFNDSAPADRPADRNLCKLFSCKSCSGHLSESLQPYPESTRMQGMYCSIQDHLHSGTIAHPSCVCRESSSAALTAISALNSEEASHRAASSSLAFPACFASAASFLAKAACAASAGTKLVRIEA